VRGIRRTITQAVLLLEGGGAKKSATKNLHQEGEILFPGRRRSRHDTGTQFGLLSGPEVPQKGGRLGKKKREVITQKPCRKP